MRRLVGLVFVIACGGSKAPPASMPAPAPAPTPAPAPVAAEPAPVDAGAAPQVAVASDPEEGGQIASAAGPPAAGLTGTSGLGEGGGGLAQGRTGAGGGLGTIGHGAGGQGEGAGIGGSRFPGRTAETPHIKLGDPKVKGKLDAVIVRRYLKRNQSRMQYCYEKQLLAKPGLAGTIRATYTIGPDGTVEEATARGFDDEVAACIDQALNAIEYPKPSDGKPVVVTFTATFTNG